MNLKTLTDDELIAIRADVEKEIRFRKLSFSVGNIGENLAIDFFKSTAGLSNLKPSAPGAKNVDALSRDGDRIFNKNCSTGQENRYNLS